MEQTYTKEQITEIEKALDRYVYERAFVKQDKDKSILQFLSSLPVSPTKSGNVEIEKSIMDNYRVLQDGSIIEDANFFRENLLKNIRSALSIPVSPTEKEDDYKLRWILSEVFLEAITSDEAVNQIKNLFSLSPHKTESKIDVEKVSIFPSYGESTKNFDCPNCLDSGCEYCNP